MAGSLSEVRELDAAAAEARAVLRRMERLQQRLQDSEHQDLRERAGILVEGWTQLLASLEAERAEARARLRGAIRGEMD